MKNKLPNIKERILLLAESVEVSKQEFFRKIDITYGNFTGDKKNRPLNSDSIENILLIYPDTNPEWLLTGKGPMLKSEDKASLLNPDPHGIPLIPLEAMAGFGEGDSTIMEYDTERYVVPEFSELNVDFMIRVKGTSMVPKYNSGDIVACKKLPLSDIFFQWNKVYVLSTIQGALIKRIKKGQDSRHITLVSENEKYDPFELELSQIHAIALVVGVIRLE